MAVLKFPIYKFIKLYLFFRKFIGNIFFNSKSKRIIDFQHHGYVMFGLKNQRNSMKLYYGLYEQEELKFFSNKIKSTHVCIDAGAGIGAYSLLFSKAKKVYSFEPKNLDSKLLELNIAYNKIYNTEIYRLLLSDKNEEIDFIECEASGLSAIVANNEKKHIQYLKNQYNVSKYKIFKIKSITIDSLNLKNLDILKIDVEGAEFKVINGALKTLKRCKPKYLLIEINDDALQLHGDSLLKLLEKLREYNYFPYHFLGGFLKPYEYGDFYRNNNFIFIQKD